MPPPQASFSIDTIGQPARGDLMRLRMREPRVAEIVGASVAGEGGVGKTLTLLIYAGLIQQRSEMKSFFCDALTITWPNL